MFKYIICTYKIPTAVAPPSLPLPEECKLRPSYSGHTATAKFTASDTTIYSIPI